MNLAITKTRPLDKNEMKFLHKRVIELWADRVGAAVKVSGAYIKAGYWMTANGFTKLVHKATSPQVEEHLKRGVSLGAGFAAGAFAASAMVPVLPLALAAAGSATVGSYMTGKITQALHNITEKDMEALQTIADNAIESAKEKKNTMYKDANEEYQDWKNYLGEEYKNRAEQVKSDVQEGWNDFKTDVKEAWTATRGEIKERAKKVKKGIEAGVDKVKTGVETGVVVATAGATVVGNKIKAGAESVADKVQWFLDKDAREEERARKKREREYSDKAIARDNARIQREADREAKKQAQAELRQTRIAERERQQAVIARAESINKATKKAEKVAEKEAKATAISQKALRFLDKSRICLGAEWISNNLLTQGDREKYLSAMSARAQVAEARQEEKRARIEAGLNLMKESGYSAVDYTYEDYLKMSPKRRAQLEQDIKDAQYFADMKKEDGLTL